MGCISSKVMTRSSSFQEELNQSLQRTANGIPILEELLISRNGHDQFLALVCTANTVAKKLPNGSFTSESKTDPKSFLEPKISETINTWELMAGLEEQGEGKEQQCPRPRVEGSIDIAKRSKSFHWSPNRGLAIEDCFHGIKDDGLYGNNSVIVRSRSFHTVQEFDAMMEINLLPGTQEIRFEHSVTGTEVQLLDACKPSSKICCNIEESDTVVKGNNQSYSGDYNCGNEETGSVEAELEITEVFMRPNSLSTNEEMQVGDDTLKGNVIIEKGLKRKAIANELTSLRIPSTIELPAIGSLGEWLDIRGQVYSPGDYITPKFGSFPLTVHEKGKKYGEVSVFDPEMVAAFEDSMQQLKAEEESILKQIAENLKEDGMNEKGE